MKKRMMLFIFIGIMMLLLFGCNRSPKKEVESAGENHVTDGYLSTTDNSKTNKSSSDQSGDLKEAETAINVEEEKENAGPTIKLNSYTKSAMDTDRSWRKQEDPPNKSVALLRRWKDIP